MQLLMSHQREECRTQQAVLQTFVERERKPHSRAAAEGLEGARQRASWDLRRRRRAGTQDAALVRIERGRVVPALPARPGLRAGKGQATIKGTTNTALPTRTRNQ